MKPRADEHGRRYFIGRDGQRVYVPAPAATDAERAKLRKDAQAAAKHIERYHRIFQEED